MVFHSHLLNPHNFLEDCMRRGYRRFWQSGLPWHLINAAIDGSFTYNVSDDNKAMWVESTGRQWENTDEPLVKSLECPVCRTPLRIPWTTSALGQDSKTLERPSLTGSGYGDGRLDYCCTSCLTHVNKELLSVAKFCRDSANLLNKGYPMPGTTLKPATGKPDFWVSTTNEPWDPRTFPNRMVRFALARQIQGLLESPDPEKPPTMEAVRSMVDDVLQRQNLLSKVYELRTSRTLVNLIIPPLAKAAIRKMMYQYRRNFSPFALDLCGAVIRQGVFTEKMCKIDWLHSPTARDTMGRLCSKYQRFIKIMGMDRTKIAVPTLDVDLAWHSHQASPFAYYRYTVGFLRRYIQHDDRIEDDKLSAGFEWTSKMYQTTYNEVYSECTCWYCESVRASHISSFGLALKKPKSEQGKRSFLEFLRSRLID